jgi:palmitoyl-protein thioesterase
MLIRNLTSEFFIDYYENDTCCNNKVIPTVLMHGVLANKENMEELKTLLELNFKIPVYNIEIGNGAITSLFTSMNSQLETLCNTIYSMDELKDGFNFIGMSQGGLLARGYVEYCNKYPVINLITLVSPNGGVFYKTPSADNFYKPLQQSTLSISNYWRDPYQYDLYLSNSTYLAQLNQEVMSNSIQDNLDSLHNFIMVWSPLDEVIMPPESAKFSLQYVDETDKQVKLLDLVDTYVYKSGCLGLKKLNEENRLRIFTTNCTHSQHREPECFHQLKPLFEEYLLSVNTLFS